MNSIFKKLSVILCCLFGLIFINPVTLASPGDYLVYFLGKSKNTLKCNICDNSFIKMARMVSCPYYCTLCSDGSIIHNTDCGCRSFSKICCAEHNNCYDLLVKYGPFCFINYENGGDFDTVFENAKNNGQLYCLGCVLGNINDRWCGKLFSNIDDVNFANCFQLKTLKFNITNAMQSRKNKPFPEHYCPGHKSEVERMVNPKYILTPKYKSTLNLKYKK